MQAATVAAALSVVPLAAIYTSHLCRASETADTICQHRELRAERVPDLQELDQGELEGLSGASLMETHPDFLEAWQTNPSDTRVPGGETLRECQERSVAATVAILEAHSAGPPVAIVTHRMVLACVICHALGLPLKMWRLVGQRNTALNLLSLQDGQWKVHHLNDTSHLEETQPPPAMPA